MDEPTPDGSYLWVFLTSAMNHGDFLAVLTLLFLFLGRFLPILALSPFFGARVLTNPAKLCLGLSIFVIFLPQLLTVTKGPILFSPMTVLLLTKEIFVGFIIGMIISIPYTIVQSTGLIIDHQRGGASLMVNDPTIQNQSSPLGTLFNSVLIFLFYYIDGPFLFLNAIIDSYTVIPPDQFLNPHFFDETSKFWGMLVQLFNQVMVISIQLSAPALLAILMTDVFLGIANRLAPQVQITFLGMPLKSLFALAVVCIGWRLLNEEVIRQAYYWLNAVSDAIGEMATQEYKT